MIAIRLHAVIGNDRKLVIQLPDDMPTGDVEVVIRTSDISTTVGVTAREIAKQKLLAAGALVTHFDIPAGATRLSVEERMRIGTLAAGALSSLDLINDDRGEL